jgi:putative peptidoglycan lipid II flippase
VARRSGALLVGAGILLSRVAGVVRLAVMGAVLGGPTGPAVTDPFAFAMRLPNILQNLLGEGSLSASFIPVYARLVEEGKQEEADDLAGSVVALLSLVTAGLVALIVFSAGPLVSLFTDWEAEKYELTVTLTRITTLGIGFLVISAWCLGVLNSHRSFFLSYVSPVIWNLAQIAVLLVGAALLWTDVDLVTALAWAVVVGGLGQMLVQLPRVRRLTPHLRMNLRDTPARRQVVNRFFPAVGARGVVQLSSFADLFLAGLLTAGALSWYTYALPLYLLPVSLFGFSVAASELAEMSRTTGGSAAIADRLKPALRQVLVPTALVAAAFFAAGPVVVDAVYGLLGRLIDRGWTSDQITVIGLVLTAFAIGLPATVTARVTQNTLYSLGDVRGPARIAAIRMVLSIAVGLVLIFQLDWLFLDAGQVQQAGDVPHWPPWERVPETIRNDQAGPPHLGVLGLALAGSVASWVEWALLRRRLQTRLGVRISSGWARPVALAGIGAAVLMAAVRLLPLPALAQIVLVGIGGVAAYAGLLRLQRIPMGALLRR